MLRILHIENVAVIEKTEIEFRPGLNVLTGETGAGKSIVIDAIGAAIGVRTSRELIRSGAEHASVTAVFDAGSDGGWCGENGIDVSDGELLIQRRISADGKNLCRVCGVPVTVGQLRELGARLLDIHGQSDGQRLLTESFHRDYLDSFAGLGKELAAYADVYDQYDAARKEAESLTMDEGEKARRMDTLKYQIDELERACIKPGETDALQERRELLKNAGKLTEAVETAFAALSGSDSSDGASSMLAEAENAAASAARYSDRLSGVAEKLKGLRYQAEDLAEELRDVQGSLEFSPDEFDGIESRLELLRRLSRKYGGGEESMLDFLDKCRKELDTIEFSADRLEKLKLELEKRKNETEAAAEALSEKRKAAAKRLEERIRSELSELSMSGARFQVEFRNCPPGRTGCDEVRFLMSANAGEELGRISRIASGGELARIMLAMKNVLAENDPIGTMVFDEVDTGVSGIAAQRVGEKLCSLARCKQVICVTHLPQIAVMADTHFEISKTQEGGRTYTHVRELDDAGRCLEIARLTGGENVTELTLSSAREQRKAAEAYKSRRG